MKQNDWKKFQFKRYSSRFNIEIVNIKFALVVKESIIVNITRKKTRHNSDQNREVRLRDQEVRTDKKTRQILKLRGQQPKEHWFNP